MFPDCVIPGCPNPVVRVGDPCSDCLRAFGPMLRPGGERLTGEQIAARDADVRAVHAARRTP